MMQQQEIKAEIINRLIDLGVNKASLLNNSSNAEEIRLSVLKELEEKESYLFFIRSLAYLSSALTIGIVFLEMFKPDAGINLNSASLLVLWTISNIWVLKRLQRSCDKTKEKVFLIELFNKTGTF